MSADHPAKFIEAEDIAKIRKSGLKAIAGVYVEDLLQAIEGSRELAETMMRDVSELRKASESFELAFQNKALGMCVDRLTIERDEARAEVQRLTEEARRSDAGRVEVPEYSECAMIDQNGEDLNPLQEFVYCQEPAPNPPDIICGVDPKAQFREQLQAVLDWVSSRLSPSPQPATGVVIVPRDALDDYRDDKLSELPTCKDSLQVPQPSADVVVVPKNPRSFDAKWGDALSGLRSSTNHDAQDAGEGR